MRRAPRANAESCPSICFGGGGGVGDRMLGGGEHAPAALGALLLARPG